MHFDRRADHGFSDLVHLHRVSLSLFTPVHRMIAILRGCGITQRRRDAEEDAEATTAG